MEVSPKNTTTSSQERESFLREMIHLTNEHMDTGSLLQNLSNKVGAFFNADRTYIFKYTTSGDMEVGSAARYLRAGVNPADFSALPYKSRILNDSDDEGLVKKVFSFSHLAEAPIELRDFLLTNEVSGAYVYEFFINNIAYGRFVLHYRESRQLVEEELLLLKSVLALTANALFKDALLTKEKKARKEAENIGNELTAIINSVPAFISFITPDLKYKYYNKQYSKFFGISNEDLVKKDIKDILGEDSYKISEKMMHRVLKGEKVAFENELLDQKKNKRHFHVQYIPNYNSENEINGFFVLANDITEIKDTERRLEEKRERLRLAIESTNLGTWDHNFITGAIILSERSREILGFEEQDQITHESFLTKIHPEDKSKVKQLMQDSIMGDSPKDYHMQFRALNGRWIKASGRLFVDSENKNIRFIGLIEDISAQIRHEEYLKIQRNHFYHIFNEAPSLICVLNNRNLTFEYVNEAFQEKFNTQKLIGKTFIDAFPELVEQGYYQLLEKVLKTGENVTGKETLAAVLDSEGELEESYFNYLIHPRYNIENNIDGVIIYANEITDLVKSKKSLESFLSIASHELKTPLTSVIAYADLLEEELSILNSDKGSTYMAKLDTNLGRLQNLINELLDVSRIQAGKVVYNFKKLQFKKFIESSIENLKPVYPLHHIHLTIESDAYINGDVERLEQVLNNLIANAIKYSPDKNQIWIEVKNNKDYITTKVIDQGIGISTAKQKELFQRFFRIESSQFKSNGLGMGLFISKEIVQRHKGEIGVHSTSGKGSTFYFNLPVYH